ncbi:MAG: (E)-4-hydroxy-3-methylbut-2-enyl-diphosphate synthase, partial [Bacteroidetes bacterium]|nr:(E)-4-hydroxy-3-methylbut-2-enyl-diphosphate synthase [Bacteroidota bacterium]
MEANFYCKDLFNYSRFQTRVVKIGDLNLGGNYPIRIQSMTNTNTLNTFQTIEQSKTLINAGCELVRITTPGMKEAENLLIIKKELNKQGFNAPIIADVHFNPQVAEFLAHHIEKVRINPGNYADKKSFKKIDFTETEYMAEIERIYARFSPLVKICKEQGTAMRIGVNHGSLSDRILSHYGDTPAGMVESAIEFIKICEDLNFHNLVLSMKSSNVQVMIVAYRMLVAKMKELQMNYPLHLGVTEAGDGDNGIIKSAIGIGSLLEDGIGDTIRVSLTGDPVPEIPVAKLIAEKYSRKEETAILENSNSKFFDSYNFTKRNSNSQENIGGRNVPIVITNNCIFNSEIIPDYFYESGKLINTDKKEFSLVCTKEFLGSNDGFEKLRFLPLEPESLNSLIINRLKEKSNISIILIISESQSVHEIRKFFSVLSKENIKTPVVLQIKQNASNRLNFLIETSIKAGAMLIDGFLDGIWIDEENTVLCNQTSFSILQAARARISKTEYISCPTCGRTSFDMTGLIEEIKLKTSHLKGLKIAIMGCVVNGPGEMADAD